jgi:ParB family chromosome partitioning protein
LRKPPISRNRELKWIAVDKIIPNERNPRRRDHFTPEQLERLRRSIKQFGILEPVIVIPYKDDLYMLIEGERRFRSARAEGTKELPAVIVNRMDEHDQLVTMFNIHVNRRGWEKAEELISIQELKQRNGHLSDAELAAELGMSQQMLRERLTVIEMGDEIIAKIAADEIDYSSALRARQVAKSMERKRPDVVEKLGGKDKIEKKLISKAKVRGGISQELVEARRELTNPEQLSDAAVVEYIEKPEIGIRDIRTRSLEEARKADSLSKELHRLERAVRTFDADLDEVPNLRALRGAISATIEALQELEERVVETLLVKTPEKAGS